MNKTKKTWLIFFLIIILVFCFGYFVKEAESYYFGSFFLSNKPLMEKTLFIANQVYLDHSYDREEFNCFDYSKDLVNRLNKVGVKASFFDYETITTTKRWCNNSVCIEQEPDFYGDFKENITNDWHVIVFVDDLNIFIEPQEQGFFLTKCDYFNSLEKTKKNYPVDFPKECEK